MLNQMIEARIMVQYRGLVFDTNSADQAVYRASDCCALFAASAVEFSGMDKRARSPRR